MPGTTASSVIDVLDPATGRPIGTARRSDALAEGMAVRTVHVFLVDDRGRLLLQLLGRGRDRHRLVWGSSAAAFPHPGEPNDAAAARRLAEELGLAAPLHRLGVITTMDGLSPKFVTLYEGTALEPPQILEPDHVERVEYRAVEVIDEDLAQDPSQFTDTFQQVYRWWRDRPR